jgi:flagellar biosynthesis/type III secretory pathway chaperone
VANELKETLGLLIEQFARLKDVLSSESDALEHRDPDALLSAASAKQDCATAINGLETRLSVALNGISLRDLLKHASPAERENLEPLHTSLTTLAWECRHYNAVNGKVIHRSRQSVAELARILSGADADSTYTARGTTRAFGDGMPITHA